jgi:SAM-dependent methyltransferase
MKFEAFDQEFAAYKEDHPGSVFADFYAHKSLLQIQQGIPHATLGASLKTPNQVTKAAVDELCEACGVTRDTRVADYGCGTLRMGRHFIRRLARRHYLGMDISQELLDIGRGLIQPPLLAKKEPALWRIDDRGMKAGIAFGADLVISTAVAFHVHPDELPTYFTNIMHLAHKPSASILIGTNIGPEGRSSGLSWARPLDLYRAGLSGFELLQVTEKTTVTKNGVTFVNSLLRFQRV